MAKRNKTSAKDRSPVGAKAAPTQSLKIVERPSSFPGIERMVWAEASSLTENPKNWKTHTKRQVDALDAELSTVGWAGALLYNLTTNRLVDGHGRLKTIAAKKNPVVPVLLGHWTEKEEEQILLHLDPIGAMFEADHDAYDKLMESFKESFKEMEATLPVDITAPLDELNKSLDLQMEAQDYGAPASFLPSHLDDDAITSREEEAKKDIIDIDALPINTPGTYGLKQWSEMPFDCYGTSGILGIPPIRPDRIAWLPDLLKDGPFSPENFGEAGSNGNGKPTPDNLGSKRKRGKNGIGGENTPQSTVENGASLGRMPSMIPWVGPETPEGESYFWIYGCSKIEKVRSNKIVVAFYTWDHKFESVWSDPRPFTARMLSCGVFAAVSPNFSAWRGAPLAFTAYQIYRARWIARYWQEAGLMVIPDLHPPPDVNDKDLWKVLLAGIPKGAATISVQLINRADSDSDAYFATTRVGLMAALEELKPRSLLAYRSNKMPKNFFKGIPGNIPVVEVETWMTARKKAVSTKNKQAGEEYLSEGVR